MTIDEQIDAFLGKTDSPGWLLEGLGQAVQGHRSSDLGFLVDYVQSVGMIVACRVVTDGIVRWDNRRWEDDHDL